VSPRKEITGICKRYIKYHTNPKSKAAFTTKLSLNMIRYILFLRRRIDFEIVLLENAKPCVFLMSNNATKEKRGVEMSPLYLNISGMVIVSNTITHDVY